MYTLRQTKKRQSQSTEANSEYQLRGNARREPFRWLTHKQTKRKRNEYKGEITNSYGAATRESAPDTAQLLGFDLVLDHLLLGGQETLTTQQHKSVTKFATKNMHQQAQQEN